MDKNNELNSLIQGITLPLDYYKLDQLKKAATDHFGELAPEETVGSARDASEITGVDINAGKTVLDSGEGTKLDSGAPVVPPVIPPVTKNTGITPATGEGAPAAPVIMGLQNKPGLNVK